MPLFDAFKKVLGGGPQSVLGIDIGASAVKVIQLKREGGRAVLENYGELALGPYAGLSVGQATLLPKEKLIVALEDLLHEANIPIRNAVISLPMNSAMVSFVKMPALSQKELESMIPIEARKYIPVPMSEVVLDWWIVPAKEPSVQASAPAQASSASAVGNVDVMLAAIRNESLETYQAVKKSVGLTGDVFEIEIFSTMRSVMDESAPLTMLLDMGAGTTKLALVERGVIRGMHTIRQGSQDITISISKSLGVSMSEAEDMKRLLGAVPVDGDTRVRDLAMLSLSHVFSEANNVLLQYQKRNDTTAGKVVMTGGGVLLKGIADIARAQFTTEVSIGDPFAKIQSPAFLSSALSEIGPGFAVAAGAALKGVADL